MKSLLYSDWCVLRGGARQYPLPALIIVAVVILSGLSGFDGDPSEFVTGVYGTMVPTCVMMISFFGFFSLFGNDEREGWEAQRLTLPVTRRTVVRSRYLSLAGWIVGLELAVNLLATLTGVIASLVLFGKPAFASVTDVLLMNSVLLAVYFAYLGIECPIMFKLGISKGRLYFSLPFLLCMLFTLEPVKEAAVELLPKLQALSSSMGSPLTLAVVAIALSLGVYYVSSLVSERIYAQRDF